VKKVIRTIHMPGLPFFTAHNTIPDSDNNNNNNNNNTDESQMQNPQISKVSLFFIWAICVFLRMEGLGCGVGVGWWGNCCPEEGKM
jgi:hypothetical protein